MYTKPLILANPPELSGKTVTDIIIILHEAIYAFEEQYQTELKRYYKSIVSSYEQEKTPDQPEPDLFDDIPPL
jgi:hypothetical protein